ncbi:hypothetical protein RCL1_006355 [Eukaryota sp. TZLM3-RCL]
MSRVPVLNREILKWLQGLDLSFSFRNVKRDFANGFLIAEIFSRYYPQDVQLHSFENGQSLPRKQDNWSQLQRFFTKRAIPFDAQIIQDTIHCKPDAAMTLIESFYTFLTKRETLKSSIVKPSEPSSFSRPTLATTLKTTPASPSSPSHNYASLNPSAMKDIVQISTEIAGENKQKIEFKGVSVRRVSALPGAYSPVLSPVHQSGQNITSFPVLSELFSKIASSLNFPSIFDWINVVNQQSDKSNLTVFRQFTSSKHVIVSAICSNSVDIKIFTEIFSSILRTIPESSSLFSHFVQFLVEIGGSVGVEGGDPVAHALIMEFFPRLYSEKTMQSKFKSISKILLSFLERGRSYSAQLLSFIRHVTSQLDSTHDLLIAFLVSVASTSMSLSNDLVDIFIYFAVVFLSHSSPTILSGSFELFSLLSRHQDLFSMISTFMSYQNHESLMVRGWLLLLLREMIASRHHVDNRSKLVSHFLTLAQNYQSNPPLTQVMTYCLALLTPLIPTLTPVLFDKLILLPSPLRRGLLGLDSGFIVPLFSSIICQVTSFDHLELLKLLVGHVVHKKLPNLEAEHLEILLAILSSIKLSPANSSEFNILIKKLRDYLIVALCDGLLVETASECFEFLSELEPDILLDFIPLFSACFKMVFPIAKDSSCHEPICQLVQFLYDSNEKFKKPICEVLKGLTPHQLGNVVLADLVDYVKQNC